MVHAKRLFVKVCDGLSFDLRCGGGGWQEQRRGSLCTPQVGPASMTMGKVITIKRISGDAYYVNIYMRRSQMFQKVEYGLPTKI